MKNNSGKFLNLNFWISEFIIISLSYYYRWINEFDFFSAIITISIILITLQYCILHAKKLNGYGIKRFLIGGIELSFILSSAYNILANVFWLKQTYQVNFLFIGFLVIILLPMLIANHKYLKS